MPTEHHTRSRARFRLARIGKGLTGILGLVLLYEGARATGVLPQDGIPAAPSVTATAVRELLNGPLTTATGDTLQAWALGLAAACAVGVPAGLALGASSWADSLMKVAVEFLRPVPAVALVPVAVVSFGLDIGMQVFLVGFACIWPILIGTRHGVRAIDPLMIDSARMLGLSRRAVIIRVSLPATLPAIATGVRLAASLGVIVAVAAEIVTGSPGLGQYLTQAQQAGADNAAFASVLMAGLLGLAVNACFVSAETRVAGWQQQSTEGPR
ncbi:ABC transporter permease [Streptomyces chartreusis]|uniref:ABC transporter permease n=1 Tax=Streptomyces chartreusis TaxID=1969 RepID=UPI003696115A